MQKKCLPNNFVQLKIIKSCPKRKENPLILCKKKSCQFYVKCHGHFFSIKYCLIFVEPYMLYVIPILFFLITHE